MSAAPWSTMTRLPKPAKVRRTPRRRRGPPDAGALGRGDLDAVRTPSGRPNRRGDCDRRRASRGRRGTDGAAARPRRPARRPPDRAEVPCSFCCAACSSPDSCAFRSRLSVDVADQIGLGCAARLPAAACAFAAAPRNAAASATARFERLCAPSSARRASAACAAMRSRSILASAATVRVAWPMRRRSAVESSRRR